MVVRKVVLYNGGRVMKLSSMFNKGYSATEYAVIASLVGVAILGSLSYLSNNVSATFCRVSSIVGVIPGTCSTAMVDGHGVPVGVNSLFVPSSMGGQDSSLNGNWGPRGGLGVLIGQALSAINGNSAIKGIYGLKTTNFIGKNNSTGSPVTSYSSLLQGLQSGAYSWGDNGTQYLDPNTTNSVSSSGQSNGTMFLSTTGKNAWNNDPNVSKDTVYNAFTSGNYPSNIVSGTNGQGTMMQVVTSDGTVYNINGMARVMNNNPQYDAQGDNWVSVTNAATGKVVYTEHDTYQQNIDNGPNNTIMSTDSHQR